MINRRSENSSDDLRAPRAHIGKETRTSTSVSGRCTRRVVIRTELRSRAARHRQSTSGRGSRSAVRPFLFPVRSGRSQEHAQISRCARVILSSALSTHPDRPMRKLINGGCRPQWATFQLNQLSDDRPKSEKKMRDPVTSQTKSTSEHGLEQANSRLFAVLGLLFLSALPDAMVVPVLRQLLVDRYDVGIGAAHLFMCTNLIGAALAIGLLAKLRHLPPMYLIAGASLLNAVLLAVMALPIGFAPTLAVRFVEGAADLAVYGALFNYLAQAGPSATRGRRMGAAATVMMLGIACGIGVGGVVAATQATLSLWLGSVACIAVTLVAVLTLSRSSGVRRDDHAQPSPPASEEQSRSPLWPALVMMFSDRAAAGILSTTVPLYFASVLNLPAHVTGALIGSAMLMTALSAWPSGFLAEKIGCRSIRLIAGIAYAGSLAIVPTTSAQYWFPALATMIVLGLAGGMLFASSLMIVCQAGKGAAGIAAYHTAGNAGFLVGPLVAGLMLTSTPGGEPPSETYVLIIVGFAAAHAVLSAVSLVGMSARQTRNAPVVTA